MNEPETHDTGDLLPETDRSSPETIPPEAEPIPDKSERADEAETLLSENARLAEELAALRRMIREQNLRGELIKRGAPEAAVPLLLLAADTMPDGDDLPDRIRASYGALFSRTERTGTPGVSPPGTLATPRSALTGMTPDEINQSWDHVRTALSR